MDRAAYEVLQVARGVLSNLDVDVVLDHVLVAARELTGATYAALGVLDESRTELTRFITSGIGDEARGAIGPPPTGRGVLGELILRPEPLRLADVGAHPMSYGFPAGHPRMTTFLGAPLLIDGTPFGNIYLTDKAGGAQFTEEDEEALVVLSSFAGIAIDHARRITGAVRRGDELERTVETLDASIHISRALGGRTNLDDILQLVAKRGRALVSARSSVVVLRRDDAFIITARAGDLPAGLVGRELALQGPVVGEAMRTRRIQHVAGLEGAAGKPEHGSRFGIKADAGLVVPLVFGGRSYGALVVLDRLDGGPAFTTRDERLLEAFAATATTSVAVAESVDAQRRSQRVAAAEEERARWARELHDETLQSLAAVRLRLADAQRTGTPDALHAAVDETIAQLEGDIADLRALITELRPAALDDLGIAAAVEALGERALAGGLDVDVNVELGPGDGDLRLPVEVELAIYRLVQEALTNAVKHGGARRAVVDILATDASVSVEVRDDGHGFDPNAETSGYGLLGMHERVELLSGTLRVASAPGEGCRVSAVFPKQGSSVPVGGP